MIDIHCHILPGLDDGAKTMDEAIAMARMASADETHTIVATAHITPGVYDNAPDVIIEAAAVLERRLQQEGIPIRIFPGADVRITPELLNGRRSYLCINADKPHLLLEFPHDLIPPGSDRLTACLLDRGVIPILTHPERNGEIQRRPERLEPFVRMGCLIQVTAMSLTGGFGPQAKESVERMMKEGHVHLIATDAHNTTSRPPILSHAVKQAAEWVGEEEVRAMVVDRPEKIVGG